MKGILTFCVAIVCCVLALSTTATAQNGIKPIVDSGMITLGPKEVLRLTVVGGNNNDNVRVRFRLIDYTAGMCNGPECKHVILSQTTSAPIRLDAGEAASSSFPTTVAGEEVRYVRAVVLSDNPNVKVQGIVFDTSTQRINAICTFIPD